MDDAGGVRGLSYFTHDSRTREAWAEMQRVTPMIWRIAPVQARIQPAGRRVALLHSVTSDIFPTVLDAAGIAWPGDARLGGDFRR